MRDLVRRHEAALGREVLERAAGVGVAVRLVFWAMLRRRARPSRCQRSRGTRRSMVTLARAYSTAQRAHEADDGVLRGAVGARVHVPREARVRRDEDEAAPPERHHLRHKRAREAEGAVALTAMTRSHVASSVLASEALR